MIAIDTNILVYAHRSLAPEHRAARRAIEQAAGHPRGWGIADICITEFWSVVTHPSAPVRPSRPREAAAFINALLDGGAHVFATDAAISADMLRTAVELDIRGPRVYDLRIALTVLSAGGTEIWTRDHQFVTLPGLRVIDPISESARGSSK